MRVLFYIGWGLLVLAFASAGAEALVSAHGSGGPFISAHTLWYTLSPGSLVLTEIRLEKLTPVLWDPVALWLLTPPAWASLGVPGAALAWTFRPNRQMTREVREELTRLSESMFVIDGLSRAARNDESYDPREDDRAPVYVTFEHSPDIGADLDAAEEAALPDQAVGDIAEATRRIRAAMAEPDDVPAGYPAPDFYQAWTVETSPWADAADDGGDDDNNPPRFIPLPGGTARG